MGQSMSLCGSRNRLVRSPSLSFAEQPGQLDALAPFYSHSLGRKDERKDDDEFAPTEQSSLYCDAVTEQLQQRVVDRTDDSDDEEQEARRPHTHAKLRRDKSSAQLSAFSSSSSLQNSPDSGSDHAYYTTDEESPLSSASSSSSLSVQATPPRAFTAASMQQHSSSHTITVSQPTSQHSLDHSHPFTQHRIDVTPALSQSRLQSQPRVQPQHQRTLTTSYSTSCLHTASYMGEVSSDEEKIPHSRSFQQLHTASSQQHTSNGSQITRLTATHSYSSSSLSLAITRPTSASSESSSPDSAPPRASYPSVVSTLAQDSQPVVTHNAVITIRPNVSSISLNTARTFRSHRRPIALDSPTPSPVQHSDVEDNSPMATNSRSLFRATTSPHTGTATSSTFLSVVCHSGLLLDHQPVSPGSHPGTCLSILRAQRATTVC